jgi:hypothetical protein
LPENRNVVLFFNSIHQIVGVITGDHYTPFSDLDKSMQDDVGQLSKLAYADLNHFLPDFEMKNGKPRQINQCAFQESRMVEPKFTDQIQGHMDPNFAGLIQGNMDQKSNSLHFFFMHLTMVVDTLTKYSGSLTSKLSSCYREKCP